MRRTKEEVDAITQEVVLALEKVRGDKIRTNKKVVDSELKSVLEEVRKIREIQKQLIIRTDAFYTKTGVSAYSNSETIRKRVEDKVIKTEIPSFTDIRRKILISGDQGADIVIKNIVKMFV